MFLRISVNPGKVAIKDIVYFNAEKRTQSNMNHAFYSSLKSPDKLGHFEFKGSNKIPWKWIDFFLVFSSK